MHENNLAGVQNVSTCYYFSSAMQVCNEIFDFYCVYKSLRFWDGWSGSLVVYLEERCSMDRDCGLHNIKIQLHITKKKHCLLTYTVW